MLSVLIVVHEFGHYGTARIFGVRVERFSLFFGRPILSKHMFGTEFALGFIPFGGYVRVFGMNEPGNFEKGSYNLLAPWKKLIVLVGGCAMNFLLAICLFFVLYFFYGYSYTSNTVLSTGANEVTLQVGDKIVEINSNEVIDYYDIKKIIGESLEVGSVKIIRNNEEILLNFNNKTSSIGADSDKSIIHKLEFEEIHVNLGFLESIGVSIEKSIEMTGMMLGGLRDLVTGKIEVRNALGGPVSIYKTSTEAEALGFKYYLFYVALMSINLMILNLLPIPALDGGHICFIVYEMIFRRPVKEEIKAVLYNVFGILLVGLMVFATINDILRLF